MQYRRAGAFLARVEKSIVLLRSIEWMKMARSRFWPRSTANIGTICVWLEASVSTAPSHTTHGGHIISTRWYGPSHQFQFVQFCMQIEVWVLGVSRSSWHWVPVPITNIYFTPPFSYAKASKCCKHEGHTCFFKRSSSS